MKKKLSLSDLKVQSFVTDIEKKNQNDLMGGATQLLCTTKTLDIIACISQQNYSQCQTCGIACTQPSVCPVNS